jgi:hypothetical protein
MPTLRRAQTLCVLLLILVTAAAALLLRQALACPIEIPPQTLRTLYKFSDRIIVARVGHTEYVRAEEHYSLVRTALYVTRNVKGKDDEAVVFLYHNLYGAAESEQHAAYKRDDQALFFLERRKEGDGYQVDDERYAVKKLSDAALEVYLARIEELERITRQEPLDKAALAEWLVRCAEEPATRWEGAYELMLSADALERENEPPAPLVAESAATDAAAPPNETQDASAPEAPVITADVSKTAAADTLQNGDPVAAANVPMQVNEIEITQLPGFQRAAQPDASLAKLLTEDQKRRLADTLFGAEKIETGEEALLDVVKNFGDARFAPYLIAQLRRVEADPPYQVEGWLQSLSDAVRSEEVTQLVSSYSENVSYYEDEETEESESAEDASEKRELTEAEAEAQEKAATERATKKRSALLKDCLAQIERILAATEVARQTSAAAMP